MLKLVLGKGEEVRFLPFFGRPRMFGSYGCKSRPNLMEGSKAQGRRSEVRSEANVEQRYGPM
jgi:hypothetical protein